MTPIDVADTWHYKFIRFMRDGERLRSNETHTCAYGRALFMNAFWFLVFMAGAGFVGYSTMYAVIVQVIFFLNVNSWSFDVVMMAWRAMPFPIAITTFAEFVIASLVLLAASIICVMAAVISIKNAWNGDSTESPLIIASVQRIKNSSLAKILIAWHNRICVPITD